MEKLASLSFLTAGLIMMVCFGKANLYNCVQCHNATNIDECMNTTVKCPIDQECFLERILVYGLRTVINAGCRSRQICSVTALLGRRSSVGCSECCSQPDDSIGPCNSRLCGLKPTLVKPFKCLSCDNVTSASDCVVTQICGTNEACANENLVTPDGGVRRRYFCEDKLVCRYLHKMDVHGKKRQLAPNSGIPVCTACCLGDYCNRQDCLFLRQNFTYHDFES